MAVRTASCWPFTSTLDEKSTANGPNTNTYYIKKSSKYRPCTSVNSCRAKSEWLGSLPQIEIDTLLLGERSGFFEALGQGPRSDCRCWVLDQSLFGGQFRWQSKIGFDSHCMSISGTPKVDEPSCDMPAWVEQWQTGRIQILS